MDHPALSEAGKIEHRSIDQIRLSLQDQVRDDFPGCRRVHDSVSAETVGQKEPRHLCNWTEYRVMVRRHFIKSGPRALGIHSEIFEYRYPLGCAGEDLLDKRGLEICIETCYLLRIIPRQQKAGSFRAKMKSVGHINNHRSHMRKLVEGLCRHQHA